MNQTTKRVIAEAALAKRYEDQISTRASKVDIPILERDAEETSPIALDTDGVPYLRTGG